MDSGRSGIRETVLEEADQELLKARSALLAAAAKLDLVHSGQHMPVIGLLSQVDDIRLDVKAYQDELGRRS